MKRILSAVIFIPIFLLIIFRGNSLYFFLFLELFLLGGLHEIFILLEKLNMDCFKFAGYLLGIFLSLSFLITKGSFLPFGISLSIILLFIIGLFKNASLLRTIYSIFGTLFGIFYVSFLLGFLILIRDINIYGQKLLFFFFIFIWAGDTFAFYFGINLGKHKLWPGISPKKSVEGAIAGLTGNFIASIIIKFTMLPLLTYFDCLLLTLLVGIIGQIGDFFESMLKRAAQVKDSGSTIPGHGGVLDRLDSILFAAPVFYWYITLAIGLK
ncbi:MAG: phosphatidate cytidylyltransferase [bacterium]